MSSTKPRTRTTAAEREQARRAAGLCLRCPAGKEPLPAEPGKTCCRPRLDRANALQKRWYAARKANGICRQCHRPLDPRNAVHCAEHAERARPRQRKPPNLCPRCRRRPVLPKQGERFCEQCKPLMQQMRRERALARRVEQHRAALHSGVCTRCRNSPPALNSKRCEDCKRYGRKHERQRRSRANDKPGTPEPSAEPLTRRRNGTSARDETG